MPYLRSQVRSVAGAMPRRRAAPETVRWGSSTSSTEGFVLFMCGAIPAALGVESPYGSALACCMSRHGAPVRDRGGGAGSLRRGGRGTGPALSLRLTAGDDRRARDVAGYPPYERTESHDPDFLEQRLARFYRGHTRTCWRGPGVDGQGECDGGHPEASGSGDGHLGLADERRLPRDGQRLLLPPGRRTRPRQGEPRGPGEADLPDVPGAGAVPPARAGRARALRRVGRAVGGGARGDHPRAHPTAARDHGAATAGPAHRRPLTGPGRRRCGWAVRGRPTRTGVKRERGLSDRARARVRPRGPEPEPRACRPRRSRW